MAETNFFWEPLSDNILQERDESGALAGEYTTEPGLYGNVINQSRASVESTFHSDVMGSTLALSDTNQNVTDTRAYSGFGETTESTGSTEFPLQYIGRSGYYKTNSEYYVRRRHYDAAGSFSRWRSPDPLGVNLLDTNLYSYVGNRPLRFFDPSGRFVIPGRPKLPANMPPCVTTAYNERCETNCLLAFVNCEKTSIGLRNCTDYRDKCLQFCADAKRINLLVQQAGPSAGSLTIDAVLASLGAITQAALREDTELVQALAATLKISPAKLLITLKSIGGAFEIYAIWDAYNQIKKTQRQIETQKLSKEYKTWVEFQLEPESDRQGRECYGRLLTGSFSKGFIEDRNLAHAQWTGFWLHPCGSKSVAIYGIDADGVWRRADYELSRDISDDVRISGCVTPDELFRIEMCLQAAQERVYERK